MSDYWDDPLLPDLYVDGEKHRPTGLLDKDGHKIVEALPPIGFGRESEWRMNRYRLLKS